MLIAYTRMNRASVHAVDDDLGKLKDLYFDGESWVVRYVTVDTGHWLPGREIPLLPTLLANKQWGTNNVSAKITKEAVKSSPVTDAAQPVSRQMEIELAKHYQWPTYWLGDAMLGAPPVSPRSVVPVATQEKIELAHGELRSAAEVIGYQIDATDGQVGSVSDLIVDDESWVVRYIVVDTGNWLPGRKVLFATAWVNRISWASQQMSVELSQERIKDSPEYDSRQMINRQFEERIYDFHGRPVYWT